ncbi:kinase-like domain-containing protein [Bombardia bombarda]|uniref:non-specific serine/threonine protein kinase n=1 Tax=Bombardia bombarda TaxID=252184 RepID=A0AA40BVM8_9PEZI|nr:kinase-like domain-containing protein [Bombardia bombarda]
MGEGEAADGWQTVLPTTHTGIERLGRQQLESYERQILKEWEATRGHWSGIGKHTAADDLTEAKKIHARFKPAPDRDLGHGSYGIVEKVHFSHNNRTICLARKHIKYRRGFTIQNLREEAHVMEKLDHEHIVRLVGTYCVRLNELYLLLWPVAVCNLDNLFNDLDALKTRQGDRDDIISRLGALDLKDFATIEQGRQRGQPVSGPSGCPLEYLQQIIGCITRAVTYCHEANIRHLDLKPSNILLGPSRVYLADFGIARDVKDRDHTMTIGAQGTPKWRAPEVRGYEDEWSMKAADVYSLGLVLLNIATVLYGSNMADFDVVIDDLTPRGRAEKLRQYHTKLEGLALATQDVQDVNAPTFSPKHIVNLTSRMLSHDAPTRPIASQVDTELVELGGIDQIYHSSCCKKSSRFVTDRMNTKLKVVFDERNQLRAEREKIAKRLEVLEMKDETYEARIQNERRAYAEKITNLQEQLEKERKRTAELSQKRPPRPRPGIPRPGSERSATNESPTPNGLTMRSIPHTRSMPNRVSTSAIPQSQPRVHTPTVTFSARPTYSQLAAGTSTPSATSAKRLSESAVRTPSSPWDPAPVAANSPNMDAAGFPLRSRNSGSRLPVAVTPTRSGTPNLNRDPSATDSTQSSVFSRLSGKSRYSAADTSVAGTPATGSPALNNASKGPGRMTNGRDEATAIVSDGVGLGLDFASMSRRESITSARSDVHGAESVVSSSAAHSAVSLGFGGSTLSSPRAGFANIDSQGNSAVKVPALPTAKSWADVAARRERRA